MVELRLGVAENERVDLSLVCRNAARGARRIDLRENLHKLLRANYPLTSDSGGPAWLSARMHCSAIASLICVSPRLFQSTQPHQQFGAGPAP